MYRHLALTTLLVGSSMLRGQSTNSTQPTSSNNQAPLKILLLPAKEVYEVGQPIELRVSLQNINQETVFVGQQIRLGDGICSLNIEVVDSNGKVSPEMHWSQPFMEDYDATESVISAVTRSWIPLPPGYSYSSTIRVSGADYDFLKKPGQYSMRAIYTSLGMGGRLNYNRLAASPDDIKKLPFPSFRGTITSDSVSIIIQNPK